MEYIPFLCFALSDWSFRFPKHWFLFPFTNNTFFKTDSVLPLTVKKNAEVQTVLSTCENPEKEVFKVVKSWRLWRLKLNFWIYRIQNNPTTFSFFPHCPHTAIPTSLRVAFGFLPFSLFLFPQVGDIQPLAELYKALFQSVRFPVYPLKLKFKKQMLIHSLRFHLLQVLVWEDQNLYFFKEQKTDIQANSSFPGVRLAEGPEKIGTL